MTSGLAVNYLLMYDLVVDMVADVNFQLRIHMLHLVVSKLLDVAMLDMTSKVANVELPHVVLGDLLLFRNLSNKVSRYWPSFHWVSG